MFLCSSLVKDSLMLSSSFGAPVKIKDFERPDALAVVRFSARVCDRTVVPQRGNEWGTETNIVGYQNLEYAFVALRVRPKAPVTGMLRIPVLVLRFSE